MQPRLSIVTVCRDQASTLAGAMDSVISQLVPGDEYIVIDGSSTDGSVELIRERSHRLTAWVSEPDRGQSHALNKGFAAATGDVFGWLNGDDLLEPGALERVRKAFTGGNIEVLCGACRYRYVDCPEVVRRVSARDLAELAVFDAVHQPSCFWRSTLFRQAGGLDEHLHYGMDWDLWLKFQAAGARFRITDEVLSVYRVTGVNKTSTGGPRRNGEMFRILRRHQRGELALLATVGYRVMWPLKRLRSRQPMWLYRTTSDALRTLLLMALGPLYGFHRVRCASHPFC